MKNLPVLNLTHSTHLLLAKSEGDLVNNYVPFKNLVDDANQIIDFRTLEFKDSEVPTFNLNTPVNIEIQPSFDGSVNLILNNDSEKPKLINSRFSVEEGDKFIIPDHKGNRDTNLYVNSQLDLDTRLYKTINSITSVTFNKLIDNGKMKCGSYHFYFKLADNDRNETDFIAESGVVTCHIGNYTDPASVRMGLLDEDSQKSISLTLNNIDSSYDLVRVYFTRTTSDSMGVKQETAYYIDLDYPINGDSCNILITGYESLVSVPVEDINPYYELASSVKTQAQCQDRLFMANIEKPKIDYEFLERESLNFLPKTLDESDRSNIGNISYNYVDISGSNSYEYYNPKNIYYSLGYWPEEYYRLGVVYILNDYTLSPVFNTRGRDLTIDENYTPGEIQVDEDGYISSGRTYFENAKGVIKLPKTKVIYSNGVKPLGINITNDSMSNLNGKVKGFFFVRQERIPTILAQGISIAKTKDDFGNIPVLNNALTGYFTQGFLNLQRQLTKYPKFIQIPDTNVDKKAAIIPDAILRQSTFQQLFTSSEFKLSKLYTTTIDSGLKQSGWNFYTDIHNSASIAGTDLITTKLTFVKDGLDLISNGDDYFSSKAGDPSEAWLTTNPITPWWTKSTDEKVNAVLTDTTDLVRGDFGSYVGLSTELPFGTIFNVRQANYAEDTFYKTEMFKTRMDSAEPFFAITDRIPFTIAFSGKTAYRGDCYIGNFSHRIQKNFIDPDLPTNTNIVDSQSWDKNYAVYQDSSSGLKAFNRTLITYKEKKDNTSSILEPSDSDYVTAGQFFGIETDKFFGGKGYKIKGCDKINRSDVNAVPLGHWLTAKIMSNINISMRDLDINYSTEEALFGTKRSFYPYAPLDPSLKLPESGIINGAANVTLSKKINFASPNVPFIKNNFSNRILYSDIHITDAFKNGYRVFKSGNFKDYTKVYGSITDLKEWYGNLFVTMEHGCLLIPVNERAVAAEGQGGMAYINTANVLPDNPRVVSDLFGSTWQESVIKTKSGIYGIDTISKKIWRATSVEGGMTLELLSDLKVQKFLNDNLNLKESDKEPSIGYRNVKTHYNKLKGDIIFTFYNSDKEWSLCYNENLQKFITRYSWTPSHSVNINNTFFSFDKKVVKLLENKQWLTTIDMPNVWSSGAIVSTVKVGTTLASNTIFELDGVSLKFKNTSETLWNNLSLQYFDVTLTNNSITKVVRLYKHSYMPETNVNIWKHGTSGIYDNQGLISPTKWYGKQERFEFEFVTADLPMVQKIFNNLKLIGNKAEPESFQLEVVGEGYSWAQYKEVILWIINNQNYLASLYVADNPTSTITTLEQAYSYVLRHTMAELEALEVGLNKLKNAFERPLNKPNNYILPKLPYLPRYRSTYSGITGLDTTTVGQNNYEINTTNTVLIRDEKLSEDRLHTQQFGNNIRTYGRVRGNMMYLEDEWDIELKPFNFKYAYIGSNEINFSAASEGRIRDKYLKIKVVYSGKDLAVIQGIKTLFTISYA